MVVKGMRDYYLNEKGILYVEIKLKFNILKLLQVGKMVPKKSIAPPGGYERHANKRKFCSRVHQCNDKKL